MRCLRALMAATMLAASVPCQRPVEAGGCRVEMMGIPTCVVWTESWYLGARKNPPNVFGRFLSFELERFLPGRQTSLRLIAFSLWQVDWPLVYLPDQCTCRVDLLHGFAVALRPNEGFVDVGPIPSPWWVGRRTFFAQAFIMDSFGEWETSNALRVDIIPTISVR